MDSYRIEWKRSAIRELRALPKDVIASVTKAVEGLSTNAYPVGVKKLRGLNILIELETVLTEPYTGT